MIKQRFELKNVKELGVNTQNCYFYSYFECVEIGKNRKGDKSIWYILPPLTNANLRTLQEVSMIYCNIRYYICKSLDNCELCTP